MLRFPAESVRQTAPARGPLHAGRDRPGLVGGDRGRLPGMAQREQGVERRASCKPMSRLVWWLENLVNGEGMSCEQRSRSAGKPSFPPGCVVAITWKKATRSSGLIRAAD